LEAEKGVRGEQLQQLEAELARFVEQLEQSENRHSDLQETLSHTQGRRNSLGECRTLLLSNNNAILRILFEKMVFLWYWNSPAN